MYALVEGAIKPVFPVRNIAIILETSLRVCEVLSTLPATRLKIPFPKD